MDKRVGSPLSTPYHIGQQNQRLKWIVPFVAIILTRLAQHPKVFDDSLNPPAGLKNLRHFIMLGPSREKIEILVWGTVLLLPTGDRVRVSLGDIVSFVTKDVILYNYPTLKSNNGLWALIYNGERPLFPEFHDLTPVPSPVHVPRPMNAFICFRRDKAESVKLQYPGIGNNDISKILGQMWREATPVVRATYKKMATEQAVEHRAVYPEYRYTPRKSADIPRRRRGTLDKANFGVRRHENSVPVPSVCSPCSVHVPWPCDLGSATFGQLEQGFPDVQEQVLPQKLPLH
uniref:Putative mating type 1-2-1 protein n=1 Tax=Phymatotrichopsis omnivora TaxID=231936 RepID=A0A8B0M5R7_9PEZI|nr:putative mating type 1-2-1 protein [Phymatotrichopsis omnivora]QTW20729.1 putative mating type 1-2-1 protein [Phymatotrichopsis omnivora]